MDTAVDYRPAQTIIPSQPSISAYKVLSAASPKQLPSFPRHHHRNRGEQSSGQATWHNTPAQKQNVDAVEPYLNGSIDEGGGISGTGYPGTVQPGTAPLPSTKVLQLEETREYSPAGRTNSMKGALRTRGSRSQSRVRRASIGSINEDITGAGFAHNSPSLLMVN